MNLISVIAGKKFDSSSKNASRFIEDTTEAINKATKNIKRNIEDAIDDLNKAIRQLERRIEEIDITVNVNVENELSDLYANATIYNASDFVKKMDQILMKEDQAKLDALENRREKILLEKALADVKMMSTLSAEELINTENPSSFLDVDDASGVVYALNSLRSKYVTKARLARIENILNEDCPQDMIKKD